MEQPEMLAAYRRLRQVRFHLNNTLVKSLDKGALEECGRRLGLLRRGTLVFDSEQELAVLMDYAIFDFRKGGRNAVQRYLAASSLAPGSDERTLLEAMTEARYGLFQVVEVRRGLGVAVRDILRGDTGFLVDIGFGDSTREGFVLATRVIPQPGFFITSGAPLPASGGAMVQIRAGLVQKYDPGATDFAHLTPEQETDLTTLVVRTLLASGLSSRIAYQGTAQGTAGGPATTGVPKARKVGRNEPCPCGSGKKYKACCGRGRC
jgi:hypothetical protein